MSTEMNKFETWEEVIVDFLQRKKDDKEEKYLKDIIKKISEKYKKQNYFDDDEIEAFFDTKKNKKEKLQFSLEFQRLKFKGMFGLAKKPHDFSQVAMRKAYCKRCSELAEEYKPHSWITKASTNAASVSFATHVIKLTHSKIDSASIYDQISVQKSGVLATTDLKEKIVDGAVSGNQFAPVFQFLELEVKDNKLATIFADENNTVLQEFTKKHEELEVWNKGFQQALVTSKLGSHFLAKQIYFPVEKSTTFYSQSYNLLCPVKSSSLAHAIFTTLNDNNQKKVRSKRNKREFLPVPLVSFPQKASIKATASNHSNASQLNGKRGGRLKLFNSQPPTWQSQLKPPLHLVSMFYVGFSYQRVQENVNYLRDFLLRFQRIDLSIKDPKKKKWIDDWINQIIEEVMIYTVTIQNIPPGWSQTEGIRLKLEHQYFLDPYRDDEVFQKARQASEWQAVICADFANWLNGRLKGKDKQFTPKPDHTRMWKALMEIEIREQSQAIDWDIKHQNREKQA